jgi:hypothetical protein
MLANSFLDLFCNHHSRHTIDSFADFEKLAKKKFFYIVVSNYDPRTLIMVNIAYMCATILLMTICL